MRRLLDHYDAEWRRMDAELGEQLSRVAHEIVDTPRWRIFRRMDLNVQYHDLQQQIRHLRDAADQDTRDRMLL